MMGLVAIALAFAIGVALGLRRLAGRDALPAMPAGAGPAMQCCPRCGSSIAADWAFCPFCARALTLERGAPACESAFVGAGPDSN